MAKPTWNRVAVVGTGLLGASIGLGLKKRRLAKHIVGIGRRTATLAAAQRVGAVTEVTTRLKGGVEKAELVIVCTPVEDIVGRVCEVAQSLATADNGGPPVLITDVGSTKAAIVRELEKEQQKDTWPKRLVYVGGHPIAGNEKRGPQHGSADLFEGKPVILSPTSTSSPEAVRRLTDFWKSLGGIVTILDAEAHDEAMASVSHLPHLLASAIANATPERYLNLSGRGWQDTTRIAAGDPVLWRQILLANRKNVLRTLRGFNQQLSALRRAIAANDGDQLEQLLSAAKKIRDSV